MRHTSDCALHNPPTMQCCGNCKKARDERDTEDRREGNDPLFRCGVVMPFWVPLSTADFASWVDAEDGTKCKAFEKKE